jgi:hypothetical protein
MLESNAGKTESKKSTSKINILKKISAAQRRQYNGENDFRQRARP